MSFNLGDKFSFNLIGLSGSSWICITAIPTELSASNGTLPVAISYITTPREYKSDFSSTNLPLACSGEI